MPSGPLVTIALAAYNQEKLIGEALDSILAQDYDNFHILVADDASTDRTADVARDYARRHPGKITVIVQPKNVGVTLNALSMRPLYAGKYVCFFAGDDLFLPHKLSKQVAALEADPEAVLCYHDLEVFDSATGRTLYRYNEPGPGLKPIAGAHIVPELLTRRCFIGGASVMVRWDLLRDVTHRPEIKRVCDWVYFIEAAHRGKVIYIDEPLVRYRRHMSNLTSITDISDEELAYDIIDRDYPMYHPSVELGRTRLELSYSFQYALKRQFRDSWRLAVRLAGRVVRRPRIIPFLVRAMASMTVQRIKLLRRTGRLGR